MEHYQKELSQIKEILKGNQRGMTITEISKAININRNSVAKYLDVLLISGHVEMKAVGPAKVFFLSQRIPITALLNFSSDYILVLDRDLKIIQINKNLQEFLQMEHKILLGQEIGKSTLPIFTDPEIIATIKEALDGNDSTRELKFPWAGEESYFRMKLLPTTFDDGGLGVTIILENFTEQKRAEETLAWEADVNASMAELARALLQVAPLEDIASLVLEAAKRLTGSPFGYVGYIDPQTGYHIAITLTKDIWEDCQVPNKDIVFKEFRGLWGWVLEHRQPLLTNNPTGDPRSSGVPPGHIPIQRFLAVPALINDTLVGQVALANSDRDYSEQDLELVEQLATLYALAIQRMQTEEALRQKTHEFGERVKELNCLYAISKLVETPNILLDEILQGVVELIPPAWQYHKITCARLILEGQEFRTENFRDTRWKQAHDIMVNGKRLGTLEVCYLEEMPEHDEGMFLKEEKRLLSVIAERVGTIIERKKLEEAINRA